MDEQTQLIDGMRYVRHHMDDYSVKSIVGFLLDAAIYLVKNTPARSAQDGMPVDNIMRAANVSIRRQAENEPF